MRIKVLALVGAALLVTAVAFVVFRHVEAVSCRGTGPNGAIANGPVPSMNELSGHVSSLKTHEAYKVGRDYVARLESSGRAFNPARISENSLQFYEIVYYLSLEFAATITPEQLETLRESGGLRFGSMSRSQQALLLKLARYSSCVPATPLQDTTLTVIKIRRGIMQVSWRINTKQYGTINWGLADGSREIANRGHARPSPDVVSQICNGQ